MSGHVCHILNMNEYEYPAYCGLTSRRMPDSHGVVGDQFVQGHIDGRVGRDEPGGVEAARRLVSELCDACLTAWGHKLDLPWVLVDNATKTGDDDGEL